VRLSHPQPHVQQTRAATPSHMHGGEYCRHSKAMLAAIDKAHLRHVHQRLETPVPVLHALPAAGKGREGRRCQSTTQTHACSAYQGKCAVTPQLGPPSAHLDA
jgi:hypothetical protein